MVVEEEVVDASAMEVGVPRGIAGASAVVVEAGDGTALSGRDDMEREEKLDTRVLGGLVEVTIEAEIGVWGAEVDVVEVTRDALVPVILRVLSNRP